MFVLPSKQGISGVLSLGLRAKAACPSAPFSFAILSLRRCLSEPPYNPLTPTDLAPPRPSPPHGPATPLTIDQAEENTQKLPLMRNCASVRISTSYGHKWVTRYRLFGEIIDASNRSRIVLKSEALRKKQTTRVSVYIRDVTIS